MIHFDFNVTDEEGEALFNAISEVINNCQERADFGKFRYREAYLKHTTYLSNLKEKMKNSKIPEPVVEEQAIPDRSPKG